LFPTENYFSQRAGGAAAIRLAELRALPSGQQHEKYAEMIIAPTVRPWITVVALKDNADRGNGKVSHRRQRVLGRLSPGSGMTDCPRHVHLLDLSPAALDFLADTSPPCRAGNKQGLIAITFDRWGLSPPYIKTDGSRT
jgi:hypothetical protein